MKKPEITGVKGTLPLGCLPRWGREGVTLLTAGEYKQINQKNRVSTEPDNQYLYQRPLLSYSPLICCCITTGPPAIFLKKQAL